MIVEIIEREWKRRNENPCARTSRVAAEDNRELNCFWSGNSVCSLQYVAGKGAPLFIESNAKFACTVEREPPSELSTISPERSTRKPKTDHAFPPNAIRLCATVIREREIFLDRRKEEISSSQMPSPEFRFIGRLSTGLAPPPLSLIPFQQTRK